VTVGIPTVINQTEIIGSEAAMLRAVAMTFGGKVACYAGSRDFPKKRMVLESVRRLHASGKPLIVLSGTAPAGRGIDYGVDELALAEAERLGMPTMVAEPAWEQLGRRAAGHIRNAIMVAASDSVACFWTGRSRGTASTIVMAFAAGKLKRVVGPDGFDITPFEAAVMADEVLEDSVILPLDFFRREPVACR
jgi:hypothetical protein